MTELTLLSSMAVKPLLAALVQAPAVRLVSMGGVEAARRVREGEAFDVAVLADDALASLAAQGWVHAPVAIAQSRVALAVREGDARPDIDSEAAVRACFRAAPSIGYSTGPSGQALLRLFERWGLADELRARLVQARPGVPVGAMVAAGEVRLGVQQLSELQLPGVAVLGCLPPPIEIVTTFSAAVSTRTTRPGEAQALLGWLARPDTAPLKRAHWMDPPPGA